MKKSILLLPLTFLVFIFMILIHGKTNMSNSEFYKNHKQISFLINKYSAEYDHELILATKEIEQKLYGKWQVGNTLGYSLKYDITGGALDNGKLDLSKNKFSITMRSPVMKISDGKLRTTGEFEDHITDYGSPVFAYYQETLNQMKQDDFLNDYSGIEGLNPDTVGTVIIAMGLSSDSTDNYSYITTGFIIINDYIIAVRQSSFYQLQKIEQ